MKKKLTVWTLLLVMLLSVCLGPAAAAEEKEDPAEVRMLNDLLDYVYQNEIMYSDLLWALDAFERFDQERNWEALQLLRASLMIVDWDIAGCALSDASMTADDQIKLMGRGVDVSFFENMAGLFQAEKTLMGNICEHLRNAAFLYVYLEDDWKITMDEVAVLQTFMDREIQYLANMIDWTLATIGNDAVTQAFNDTVAVYCPLTRAHQAETLDTPDRIEVATNELLNLIDESQLEDAKIIGARTNQAYVMSDVIEEEDMAYLIDNRLDISDLPLTLFFPGWFSDAEAAYFWIDNEGALSLPQPGTVLDRMPDVCRIRAEGVSLEEVIYYMLELHGAGISTYDDVAEDDKVSFYYYCDGSSFALIWENDTADILMSEKPVGFAPYWYVLTMQEQRE